MKIFISLITLSMSMPSGWAQESAPVGLVGATGSASTPVQAEQSVPKKKIKKAVAYSQADDACTSAESWNFGPMLYSEWRDAFEASLSSSKPVRGFSQALALRKLDYSTESKVLAEYWISRSLYSAELVHIAFNGFAHIAAREATEETRGVQLAAMECLNQIHAKYPTFTPSEKVASALSSYSVPGISESQKRVIWEFATHVAKARLADDRPNGAIASALRPLEGSGPYENLIKVMWSARKNDHSGTIRESERFLSETSLPPSLIRYNDQVRLILARAYYTNERFDKAEEQLKKVRRSSNELAKSLSELAWAYLQNEKYSEAIGTAINLQQGGLRHTFAPEAPMVMAMALNEICQYPESVRAVSTFKKFYEKPYRWLASYQGKPASSRPELYGLAVDYVKLGQNGKARAKFPIPDKVASEWVRSPIFISHQDELNLIFDERDATVGLGKSGSVEQKAAASAVKSTVMDLKPRIRAARAHMKQGEMLPKLLRVELTKLRSRINDYKRFRKAAPVWQVLLSNHKRSIVPRERSLIATVNADLSDRSERMLIALEEIAENNQLIEVEIYNGASQDIIWQNAHPEYKKIAEKMKADSQKETAQMLNWGRSPSSDDDGGEIWEDELGSFKANLFNNCESKDKFLALKKVKRGF